MDKKLFATSMVATFTIVASLFVSADANAEETANFQNLGTFQTPSLTVGSVTVTGSNLVNVLNLNGLGIVGGAFDSTIDPGETISFSFAGPASNVRVVVSCAAGDRDGDGLLLEVRLEAFDEFGALLGQVDTFPGHCLIDFSGTLGVDTISRLDVTMLRDGIRIGRLAFDILPTCDIQLSQETYIDGETVTADVLRFANPSAEAAAVEIKTWFVTPDSNTVSLINAGANGSIVLPPGSDIDLGPLPLLPVTPGLPRETWELDCRLLDPVTGEELAVDVNPFEVQ